MQLELQHISATVDTVSTCIAISVPGRKVCKRPISMASSVSRAGSLYASPPAYFRIAVDFSTCNAAKSLHSDMELAAPMQIVYVHVTNLYG